MIREAPVFVVERNPETSEFSEHIIGIVAAARGDKPGQKPSGAKLQVYPEEERAEKARIWKALVDEGL